MTNTVFETVKSERVNFLFQAMVLLSYKSYKSTKVVVRLIQVAQVTSCGRQF